jgi:hypothetical protein
MLILVVFMYYLIVFANIEWGVSQINSISLIVISNMIAAYGFVVINRLPVSETVSDNAVVLFYFVCVFGTTIAVVLLFAKIYYMAGMTCEAVTNCGLIDSNGNVTVKNFWDALYFSIVTWTTLGYGDIIPSRMMRPFVEGEVIDGWISMTVAISVLINIFRTK